MFNHPPQALLYSKLTTFIQKNTLIPTSLNNLTQDDLDKIAVLKNAIQDGDAKHAIFKDEKALLYVLYLLKHNQIEDNQAATVLIYITAIMSNYKINIVDLRQDEQFKKQFVNDMLTKAKAKSLKIDEEKIKQEIDRLQSVDAWVITTEPSQIKSEDDFLNGFFAGFLAATSPMLSIDKDNYIVPSVGMMNLFVAQFSKNPIKFFFIFGIISAKTLRNLHILGYHPIQLHGGALVKNNLEEAHGRELTSFAILLHDIYHAYSGSLFDKEEHAYLFNELLPQLDILIDLIEHTVEQGCDTIFVQKLKKILYHLIDMDVGIFQFNYTQISLREMEDATLKSNNSVTSLPFFQSWVRRQVNREKLHPDYLYLLKSPKAEMQAIVMFYFFLSSAMAPEAIKHLSPIVTELSATTQPNQNFQPDQNFRSILYLFFDLHVLHRVEVSSSLQQMLIENGLTEAAQHERKILTERWIEFLDTISVVSPKISLTVLQSFVEQNVNLNLFNHAGYSILYLAIKAQDDAAISLILKNGFSFALDKKYDGKSCIEWAWSLERWDIIKLLVMSDVKRQVDLVVAENMSLLHAALRKNDLDISLYLIKQGADCEKIPSCLLEKLIIHLAQHARWDDVNYLLSEKHFDANSIHREVSEENAYTLLEIAVNQGKWEQVKSLVHLGANINYFPENKNRIFLAIIQAGQLEIMEFLIGKNKERYYKPEYMSAAILKALIDNNQISIFHCLWQNNFAIRLEYISFIFKEASWEFRLDCIDYLHSMNMDVLPYAIEAEKLDLIEYLLKLLIKKGEFPDDSWKEKILAANQPKLYEFICGKRLSSIQLINKAIAGIENYRYQKEFDYKSPTLFDLLGRKRSEFYLMLLQSPSLAKFTKEVALYSLFFNEDGKTLQNTVAHEYYSPHPINASAKNAFKFFKNRVEVKAARAGIDMKTVDKVVHNLVKYANSKESADETVIQKLVAGIQKR
ncbi:MAG: hypothetical protein JO149_01310 [Gammaproteobacteria bacterium]|nr:hypothetical protein [Gammaproteobacteria bacterium]